ncbi:MAG: DUF4981 domain-containing protein [Verrucomicrobiales bacterium]|nr:DUF4981 domain-containing protein [Verrucomicrobiales bacterium]
MPRGAEAFITFNFYTKTASAWAPQGHLVAWEQIQLAKAAPAPQLRPRPLTVTADRLTVSGGDWQLRFNKTTGLLTSLSAAGREWLADADAGPRLQVWRAATDNDGIKLRAVQNNSLLSRWLAHNLDQVRLRLKDLTVSGSAVRAVHEASGRGQWDDFRHEQLFAVLADGSLRVTNRVTLGRNMTVDLPRVGVVWRLAPGLEQVRWLGLGPLDNYSDRRAAAIVSVHENTVSGLHVPYVMPQEHGNHTATRWVELRAADGGAALRFTGAPLLDFSASHYTADDLFKAKHTIDLTPRPETVLNLDLAQRGLGTASCGPDTLEQYRLHGRRHTFTYTLTVA